ncbi:MAG: hypothetical protein J0I42_15135 [Bosea sp.]|uniref:hypothetical protein n=1 Tax=Bosea sp. (in: a-proteobacteria) TaxID=1871050 RepID=UPI001AC43E73|nr:hypothetical protein [Bosea sp. (in: a-proteobacteria)]MBN9453281.1 hypothetical protein [Bosea sp. (in: a-proteobacteria)]
MPDKPTVVLPVVRPAIIALSSDPRGDATIKFETGGDSDLLLVLPMTALIELEAMLAKASQEQAKTQPVQ